MTPLLLLHGALGSAAQFDEFRPLLPPELPVFAPNFPGHGGLHSDTAFSIPHFTESMITYLDQQQLGRVQVFGYSMGGYVALYLAWKYPERVESITTLGTKFDWTPDTAAWETARLDPEKIAAKVPAFAQLLAGRHAPDDWQAVVRRTSALLRGLGNAPTLSPDAFGTITCPVRIGLGELDNMVTAEESQMVVGLLPKGIFEILPGSPHPFEQVNANILAGWLIGSLL